VTALEPLEEFVTPSRAYVAQSTEVLLTFVMEGESEASIGRFRVGVTTYSRWSERHLPQIELLAGNPSENLCPVEGVSCSPEAFS
jgi:hypothetical protein